MYVHRRPRNNNMELLVLFMMYNYLQKHYVGLPGNCDYQPHTQNGRAHACIEHKTSRNQHSVNRVVSPVG